MDDNKREITEDIDFDLSDQDKADLDLLMRDQPEPEYHTVLEIWKETLREENFAANSKITPQWAQAITAGYMGVTFADMPAYVEEYFTLLRTCRQIVLDEIDTDDQALHRLKVEEDAADNAHHYKNILRDWQLEFLRRELEWDCTAPDAGIQLAALGEAHKLLLGQNGLTGHLEVIKLEFTEEDRDAQAAALMELRASYEEGARE